MLSRIHVCICPVFPLNCVHFLLMLHNYLTCSRPLYFSVESYISLCYPNIILFSVFCYVPACILNFPPLSALSFHRMFPSFFQQLYISIPTFAGSFPLTFLLILMLLVLGLSSLPCFESFPVFFLIFLVERPYCFDTFHIWSNHSNYYLSHLFIHIVECRCCTSYHSACVFKYLFHMLLSLLTGRYHHSKIFLFLNVYYLYIFYFVCPVWSLFIVSYFHYMTCYLHIKLHL